MISCWAISQTELTLLPVGPWRSFWSMNFSLDLILEVTTIINHNLAAVSFSTILQSTFTPAFMMLSSLTMAVQLAGKQMRLINFIKCNPFVLQFGDHLGIKVPFKQTCITYIHVYTIYEWNNIYAPFNCSIITTIINQLTCWKPEVSGFFGRAKTTTFKGDPAVSHRSTFQPLERSCLCIGHLVFSPKKPSDVQTGLLSGDAAATKMSQKKTISKTHHTIHGWCVWYIYVPTFGW